MKEYDADYYRDNGSSGDRPALRWYAAILKRNAPMGPALDFGCGTGWMLKHLSGFTETHGIEASEYSRAQTAELNPGASIHATLDEVPDAYFAAISAIHVVEHIPAADISDVLGKLGGKLMVGGVMLVVTPDLDGAAHQRVGQSWRAFSDPTHINLRGHGDWVRLVGDAGLDVISQGTDGLWDPPYGNWVVDRLRIIPIGLQVLSGRLFLKPGTGESSLLVARRSS